MCLCCSIDLVSICANKEIYNNLVSQHSTGAPPDRHSSQLMTIVYSECYVLVISKLFFFPSFNIFYYHHDLKIFNNFMAFKCLCHIMYVLVQGAVSISCLFQLIIEPILSTYFISTKHFCCQCEYLIYFYFIIIQLCCSLCSIYIQAILCIIFRFIASFAPVQPTSLLYIILLQFL